MRTAIRTAVGTLLAATLAAQCPAVSPPLQRLVPASFGARTDSQGFSWDINQQGSIDDGTNDCFDGGLILTVNGQQFQAQQNLMSADGSELVLSAKMNNLDVTRRVRLDSALAFVRYVETFKNTTNATQNLAVLLYSNMGGAPQPYVSDQGTPISGALGKNESAMVAFENPGNNRPSVVFYLAAARSKTKPVIAVTNGSDDIQVTYNLQIRAGRTVSIMHAVAQRRFPSVPDPKTMATLLKPLRSSKFVRDLPAAVRRTIVNTSSAYFVGGGPLNFTVAAALGIEPETVDVLTFGEETRLRGVASCESMLLESRYGRQELDLEDVAAIVGARRLGKVARVYLRDRQVLSGKLEIRGLRFTENTGVEIELQVEALDRLVMHVSPDDGHATEGALAYVETFHGDRLAVAYDVKERLALVTPWGIVRVPLDDVAWFRPPDSGEPGHQVRMKDGTTFFAYLDGAPLELRMVLFGNHSVPTFDIRGLQSASTPRAEAAQADTSITRPYLVMHGGHMLVGQIDLPSLRIETAGEIVEVSPGQIRVLRNMSDELDDVALLARGPLFAAEMWGGSVLVGHIRNDVLPVRLASQSCRIPVEDINEVHVPTPTISDSLRRRIQAAIRDLGHADWKKRERATQQLTGIGYLAKTLVQEAISQANDPEVRRRCESILAEIDE